MVTAREQAWLLVDRLLEKEDPDSWVGFDLDGTLAAHHKWNGMTKIGKPIPKMVRKLRRYISHGQKCKIFTARASDERGVNAIKKWLKANELPDLEITNVKDEHCIKIYDDKAVGVVKNTGKVK